MVLELNKFGVDLEKETKRPNVIYISSALTSAIFGVLTALACVLISDKLLIWIIMDVVGTYLGPKSLIIILKIVCASISFLKNSNVQDVLMKKIEGMENTNDDKPKKQRKKKNIS
jgi:hypothetical protein